MKSLRFAVGLFVAVLALSACSSEGGLASGNGYSVLRSIAQVPSQDVLPSGGSYLTIVTGDIARAEEIADVTRPSSVKAPSFIPWVSALFGPVSNDDAGSPIYLPVPTIMGLSTMEFEVEIDGKPGWSVLDIDSYVELSGAGRFAVFSGKNLDVPETSEAHKLNANQFFASKGHEVATSVTEETANAWAHGLKKSLADDEQFSAVATALDSTHAVGATLTETGRSWDEWLDVQKKQADDPAIFDDMASALPSSGGPVYGIGWSVTKDKEPVTTIAYHFGTPEAAKAALPVLETYYSGHQKTTYKLAELMQLVDTKAVGSVAIVTVTPQPGQQAGLIARILQQTPGGLPLG